MVEKKTNLEEFVDREELLVFYEDFGYVNLSVENQARFKKMDDDFLKKASDFL